MASAVYQPGGATNITLIFVRPFDNFYVLRTVFHFFDSSMASRTARI